MGLDLGPALAPSSATVLSLSAGSGLHFSSPIDMMGYSWWNGYFTAVGTGAGVGVQWSQEGSTWVDAGGSVDVWTNGSWTTTAAASSLATYSTGGQSMFGVVGARYMRIKSTNTTTGTYTFVVNGVNSPPVRSGTPTYLTTVNGPNNASDSMLDSIGSLPVIPFNMGFIGGSFSAWTRLRTPSIYKNTTAAAAGDNAIWTPTSGRKFRLMRYKLHLTGDATLTGGGTITVTWRDATTAMALVDSLYLPATAVNVLGGFSTPWVDLANGILSIAADRVLNLNLSSALTTGTIRVTVCGTEE